MDNKIILKKRTPAERVLYLSQQISELESNKTKINIQLGILKCNLSDVLIEIEKEQ